MFDGEKIVLPTDVHGQAAKVVVEFPEGVLAQRDPDEGRSIFDVINSGYRSGRSVDDVNRQIAEDRDGWVDP